MWINCVGAGIWVSGVGWLIVHYLFKPQVAFGFQSNSSEPWWLKVHGAAAFLSLWTGGLLWGLHVVRAWNERRLRWSGGTLFAMLVVLSATGYLLYYVADDRARELISLLHWVLGLAIPVVYLTHRIAKNILRPRVPAPADL